MDIKTIQIEFGKECKCENDVIRNCILKTRELMSALKVLGIDTSRSTNLDYIYTYFLLKLQDTKEEKQQIEREKLKGVIHNERKNSR